MKKKCDSCLKYNKKKKRCRVDLESFNIGLCNWYEPGKTTFQYWIFLIKKKYNYILKKTIFYRIYKTYKELKQAKYTLCCNTPLTIYNVNDVFSLILKIGDDKIINAIIKKKIVQFNPGETYHDRLLEYLKNINNLKKI